MKNVDYLNYELNKIGTLLQIAITNYIPEENSELNVLIRSAYGNIGKLLIDHVIEQESNVA